VTPHRSDPPSHPSWWCDHPHAPADATHTHTRTIGVVDLHNEVSIDAVMVQTTDDEAATLVLHVTAGRQQLSLHADAAQAWLLAGILVDATVLLRRAALDVEPAAAAPRWPEAQTRPEPGSYLVKLARRRKARASGRVTRAFRCLAARSGEPGPTGDHTDDTDQSP
jgi:hypothetical protein